MRWTDQITVLGRAFPTAVVLAAILVLTACSGTFRIVPSLSPEGHVVFGFFKSESEPTEIDVCHIRVDERVAESRVTVWEAQRACGDGVEISKVAYGSANGWRASVRPQPLTTHRRYTVTAGGGGLNGQAEFVLGEGGRIGVIPPR
jgi:hypothetical protein